MNVYEILRKYAKLGDKFYSLEHGECALTAITSPNRDNYYPIEMKTLDGLVFVLTMDGNKYYGRGECILFPSKDQRDWQKFVDEKEASWQLGIGTYVKTKLGIGRIENHENDSAVYSIKLCRKDRWFPFALRHEIKPIDHYDPSELQPMDVVLVRNKFDEKWDIKFYDHIEPLFETGIQYIVRGGGVYYYCIPYNEETKDLLDTTNLEPEFYRK